MFTQLIPWINLGKNVKLSVSIEAEIFYIQERPKDRYIYAEKEFHQKITISPIKGRAYMKEKRDNLAHL